MKVRRILCLLLCLVLCLSAVSCGDTPGSGKKKNGEHEPIRIVSGNLVYRNLIDAIHEKYPEINIEVVSYAGANMSCYMKQSLHAGDIPDIYTSTYFFGEEDQEKYLLDLSSYGFVNNYSDAMLRSVNLDGAIYLLPSYYNLYGIYYNKTVFEKYGWEVPKSFDELLALKEKCDAEGIDAFRSRMDLNGYVFTYLFGLGNTMFFDTQEGDAWKKDFLSGKADAVGTLEPVLEYMKKWIDAGFIDAGDIGNNSSNPAFMGGLAAMHLCTSYTVKSLDWSVREDHPEYGLQEYGIIPYLSEHGDNNMLITNIQRYFGLNRELAKPGNEQKLEDALHVLEFISTYDGSYAMGISGTNLLSSLSGSEISEESFYYEVKDVIDAGQIMPYTWVGWEDICNQLADVLHAFVRGEKSISDVCRDFDRIRNDYLANGYEHFACSEDDLDERETARLLGIADIKAADADAALVSLPGFGGYYKYEDRDAFGSVENNNGVSCGVYAGAKIGIEEVNMIRQNGKSLYTAEVTGKELREIADGGLTLSYPEVSATFPYVLITKNDAELDDAKTYKLVFAVNDVTVLPEERLTELEISPYTALADYLTSLGTFKKTDIKW